MESCWQYKKAQRQNLVCCASFPSNYWYIFCTCLLLSKIVKLLISLLCWTHHKKSISLTISWARKNFREETNVKKHKTNNKLFFKGQIGKFLLELSYYIFFLEYYSRWLWQNIIRSIRSTVITVWLANKHIILHIYVMISRNRTSITQANVPG